MANLKKMDIKFGPSDSCHVSVCPKDRWIFEDNGVSVRGFKTNLYHGWYVRYKHAWLAGWMRVHWFFVSSASCGAGGRWNWSRVRFPGLAFQFSVLPCRVEIVSLSRPWPILKLSADFNRFSARFDAGLNWKNEPIFLFFSLSLVRFSHCCFNREWKILIR